MLESLLALRMQPRWQETFWNVLAFVGVLWFLTGSTVAFLREAKAVRVAREALTIHETDMDRLADNILSGFLQEHPDHNEAVYLAAIASARVESLDKASQLRTRVEELDPERVAELDPEIVRAIDSSIFGRKCWASEVLKYYDNAAPLRDAFQQQILTNIQQVVRRCQTSRQEQAAYLLMAGMVERGAGDSLIEETYLQPLRGAVAGGRYAEAESLAQGASRFPQETSASVKETLHQVRGRVEASVRSLDETCRAIRAAPGNRVGRFWCFPPEAPAILAEARDGWGHALRYTPLQLDQNLQCHQGFEVISYGADGAETAEITGRPDADLVCRFIQGREERRGPSWFWRQQT